MSDNTYNEKIKRKRKNGYFCLNAICICSLLWQKCWCNKWGVVLFFFFTCNSIKPGLSFKHILYALATSAYCCVSWNSELTQRWADITKAHKIRVISFSNKYSIPNNFSFIIQRVFAVSQSNELALTKYTKSLFGITYNTAYFFRT